MVRNSFLMASVGLAIVILFTDQNMAEAQDAEATTLKPITITAAKKDGRVSEVVDEKDIQAKQPTTLNELFAASPEVTVSGANRTAAQKVYVRGLEETNLNVTIDGAKQGGSLYSHTGRPGIDPELLKRVEVEPGTGSALSGPGALGGVIRYETKDAEDLLLPGQKNGAMAKFSAQTNGKRLSPAAAVYGAPNENFSYLLYGTKAWADDYKDGAGNRVSDTDSEPLNGLLKFRLRPAEDHEIRFSTDYLEDNGLRAYRSNFGVPLYHPDSTPEQQEMSRRTTSLKYTFDPADNPWIDFSATVYDNKITLERLIADPLRADWQTRGLDLRNRSEIGDLTLTYGYDYTWDRSTGKSGSGHRGIETGQNHGLYLQGDYAFTEQFSASAGLRYDRGLLTDLAGNHYDSDHLSPNIGVRYEPLDGLALFASWGEAFRGVRPVEGLTLVRPQGIGADTDTSLTGETARTAQAGFDIDTAGWRAGLTGYVTKVEDSILFWRGSAASFARRNGGDIDMAGFTAHVGKDWGNLSADFSYSHSKIDYNGLSVGPGDWLSGVTPQGDKIALNLGYEFADYNLQLTWTSTFVLAEKDLPAGAGLSELPAYDVHDVSLVWQPTAAHQVSLAVTNIFDEHYLDHSTPYFVTGGTTTLYEMGRSFRLAVTVKF